MDYSEKWGKDVDEAVRLALEDLGLTEDQVMVTVLEEPVKGFLGLGQKLAKVRVEKMKPDETTFEPQAEGNKEKPIAARDLRKKNRPQQGGGNASGGERNRNDSHAHGEGRSRSESQRPRNDSRPPRNRRSEESYEEFSDFDFPDRPSLSERPADLEKIEDNEATRFLRDIIANMNLEVSVDTFQNAECVFLEVEGPDSKTVIGKRGQTLDSIQYLTNLVANKEREEYMRVIIDVEGYRSRREKTLERLAVKLARKVQASGRSVKLEPMNPYERKVIHSTLQALEGITTRSEGEEPYRRVIIEKAR
ncbi:MAG: protein jag [Clostridiales Family XIII bacterium]|jgi:spoIIIJ-associated protein|nr:protein jag [Clostridiales Family XIII bacterium]